MSPLLTCSTALPSNPVLDEGDSPTMREPTTRWITKRFGGLPSNSIEVRDIGIDACGKCALDRVE